jgi:hypothetical protein
MRKNQIYHLNEGGDEQYTPRGGVEILLPHIQHLKGKTIWCPFDREDSQFVKVLSENGFTVVYSHIDNGQDFFSYEPEQWDVLISNPPYHNKRQFFQRCLDLNKPFALLLPINILSDGIINEKLKGREGDLSLLIPNKRMRFYNRKTGAVGNSPTFKAAYIGVGIFTKPIILQDMEVKYGQGA